MSEWTPTHRYPTPPDIAGSYRPEGAFQYLLQDDPAAMLVVELVDQPVELPDNQFEALLFESECEV